MKTIQRLNNMLELSFEGKCLKELQSFAYGDNTGTKAQVENDLKRIYSLTFKDKLGDWSYIREKTNVIAETQTSERKAAMIEPDPDEFFFSRIESLDKNFQDFILQNFHQGGMFFAGRRFLTFHVNALGFMINGADGLEHHITCEIKEKELVITESFNVIKLDFLHKEVRAEKITCEKGLLYSKLFEETKHEKIDFFQNYIKAKLTDKINSQKIVGLQLGKNLTNQSPQLSFNSEQNPSLMELTVKHTITLDSNLPCGVKIKPLSKENVSFLANPQLYSFSSKASEFEFSKFLTPELRYDLHSASFFAKPKFKTKINESILNSCRDFILILLNIIFNLIFHPIAIPAKASFFPPPTESYESQNSFAYRMRA